MSESKLPRPTQVTVAGWLVILGSLATLVSAYVRMANLHSIETRQSVRRMLDEPPLSGSGIDLGTVLDVLHALALVAGACAVVALILGWQVMRRDRRARLVLTIVAVPLLLTGLADEGFSSTIAAIAVVLLWVPPSRDWFDGVQRSSTPAPGAPPPPPSAHLTPRTPGPTSAATQQSQAGRPVSTIARPQQHVPAGRPAQVVWAALLTWIFCALATALMVASGLLVSNDPGQILKQGIDRDPALAGQGITEHLLVVTMWVTAGIVIACCVAASVAAALLWRRVATARIVLLAFVIAAVVATLLMTLAAAQFVVGLAGSVATLALLLRPEVKAWLGRR